MSLQTAGSCICLIKLEHLQTLVDVTLHATNVSFLSFILHQHLCIYRCRCFGLTLCSLYRVCEYSAMQLSVEMQYRSFLVCCLHSLKKYSLKYFKNHFYSHNYQSMCWIHPDLLRNNYPDIFAGLLASVYNWQFNVSDIPEGNFLLSLNFNLNA